jgi:hypothetical protein
MKFLTAYQLLQSTGKYVITPPAEQKTEVSQTISQQNGTEAESTVQSTKA